MLSLLTMSQAGQYCWPIQARDKARVLVAALHWLCVVQARDISSWRAELVVARHHCPVWVTQRHGSKSAPLPLFPLKADTRQRDWHVSLGPLPEVGA
jgi:hypothetical protein